ncbi:metal dependent hydrolase [Ignicoccus pacificus DSM 13166]|uniref:Metal dependent hydrolase n=1 Tax=Ignicoccus pacificus DSM 13166 TaxID=940294 RepID=A0A977K8W1_9CREN|nr:metal dependent hydrolase [Ignicoccus pacificus DSM 13166]
MIDLGPVLLSWLGHDGFKIIDKNSGLRVATDPFRIAKGSDDVADLVFITHEHFDHCSPNDLAKIVSPETVIVAPEICEECLAPFDLEKVFVRPLVKGNVGSIPFYTIPAYNVNKFRAPGVVFHPKEDGRVGYVFEVGGIRFYHAGDTDVIPEMEMVEADVALLPVSGVYVMTPEEAVEALKLMKGVKVAIPMHWGTIVGDLSNALRFKELVEAEGLDVQVIIPEREPW